MSDTFASPEPKIIVPDVDVNSEQDTTCSFGAEQAPRPVALPVNLDGIPNVLKAFPHWVTWKNTQKAGKNKWVKLPLIAEKSLRHAKSNDPSTWRSFEQAKNLYESLPPGTIDGIGIMLTPEMGIVGIDIDHCYDPATGEMAASAELIANYMDSYTTFSPSGTGLRIFVYGTLPDKTEVPYTNKTKNQEEIYNSGRFLTVTGQSTGSMSAVAHRQEEINSLLAKTFRTNKPTQRTGNSADFSGVRDDSPLTPDDLALLEKIKAGKSRTKFAALWLGDTNSYNGDSSRADLALCGLLAFATKYDKKRTDRLFRHSGLMREKWDEMRGGLTYGETTLLKAFGDKEFGDEECFKLKLNELTLPVNRVLDKEFLEPSDLENIPENKKLVIVVSPTGSNKTRVSASLGISVELAERNSRIAPIAKAKGLTDFRNIDDLSTANTPVVSSYDSWHKFSTENYDGATTCFDELDSALDHLHGDTIAPHLRETLNALKLTARHAKRNYGFDANATDEGVANLAELAGASPDEIFIIRNDYVKPKGRAVFHKSKHSLSAQLVTNIRAGQKVAIPCDTLKQSKRLDKRLKKLTGLKRELRIKLINSETEADEVQEALSNPETLRDYDVLIYTPTMFSGADISFEGLPHFDAVFCYRLGDHLSPDYIHQAINRVRETNDKVVHLYCKQYGFDYETDADVLFANYERDKKSALGVFEPHERENRLVIAAPYRELIRIHFRRVAKQNAAKMNFVPYLKLLLERKGYEVSDAVAEDAGATAEKAADKEVATEVETERIETLERARVIDFDEMQSLKTKADRTRSEHNAVARYFYRQLNGDSEVGLSEAFAHDYRTLRKQVYAAEDMQADDTTLAARQRKLNSDGRLKYTDIISPAKLRREIEAAYGGWEQTGVIGMDSLTAFAEVVKRRRADVVFYLGLKFTDENLDDPSQRRQCLSRYLKTLGLSTSGKAQKVKGKVVRSYTIQPEAQAFLSSVLSRRATAEAAREAANAAFSAYMERRAAEDEAEINDFWEWDAKTKGGMKAA